VTNCPTGSDCTLKIATKRKETTDLARMRYTPWWTNIYNKWNYVKKDDSWSRFRHLLETLISCKFLKISLILACSNVLSNTLLQNQYPNWWRAEWDGGHLRQHRVGWCVQPMRVIGTPASHAHCSLIWWVLLLLLWLFLQFNQIK